MRIFTPEWIWPLRVNDDRMRLLTMWKNVPFKGSVYFSITLNLILIIFVIVIEEFLPPVVPLFYGLPSGIDQLVPSLTLILAPILGLITTLINIIISSLIEENFLKKTLIVSSVFISLLFSITVVKIILLVGFF